MSNKFFKIAILGAAVFSAALFIIPKVSLAVSYDLPLNSGAGNSWYGGYTYARLAGTNPSALYFKCINDAPIYDVDTTLMGYLVVGGGSIGSAPITPLGVGNWVYSTDTVMLALVNAQDLGRVQPERPGIAADICGGYMTITDISPAPSSSVSLEFPNQSSTIPDFTNWVVMPSNLISSGVMTVNYGQNSSSLQFSDSVFYSPYVNIPPAVIHKSQSLWFPPLLNPATWYAQATFNDGSSTISSPLTTFYVNPNLSNPTSTTTSTILAAPFFGFGDNNDFTIAPTSTDCVLVPSFWSDPTGNNIAQIENGICGAFIYLFIPSKSQQVDMGNRFNAIGEQIKYKPPFGYFYGVYSGLQSFQNNGTSTPLGTASTTTAFSVIFLPIDAGLSIMLWVIFAFWVVRTIRHLNT